MKLKTKHIHSRNLLSSWLRIGALSLIMVCLYSCSSDEEVTPNGDGVSGTEATLRVSIDGARQEVIDDLRLFAFDQYSSFEKELILNKTNGSNVVKADWKGGTWDFILVSSIHNNLNANGYFHTPQKAKDLSQQVMFKLPYLAGDSLLDNRMPELLYETIDNWEMINLLDSLRTYHRNDTLVRNVAKIRVIIDASNYDLTDAQSGNFKNDMFVELYGIPTTLSWSGRVYPDTINPELSTKPMRMPIELNSSGTIDPIEFIIPAHRGSDSYQLPEKPANQLVDILKRPISIRVCIPFEGKRFYGINSNPIEIKNHYPLMNRIMEVSMKVSTDALLDVKVVAKPWGNTPVTEHEF